MLIGKIDEFDVYAGEGFYSQHIVLPVDEWHDPQWWKDYWMAAEALQIRPEDRMLSFVPYRV